MTISTYETAIMDAAISNPDPIIQFKAMTSVENPNLDNLMGLLAVGVSHEDFSAICQNFAKGVEYVAQRFHTQPSALLITGQPSSNELESTLNMVELSHQPIAHLLKDKYVRSLDTEPYILNAQDAAIIKGVREAYAVHLAVTEPDALKDYRDIVKKGGKEWMEHPIFKECQNVVHDAMIAFHMPEHSALPSANMDPKSFEHFVGESSWAKPDLQARTHVPSSSTTPESVIDTHKVELHSPATLSINVGGSTSR